MQAKLPITLASFFLLTFSLLFLFSCQKDDGEELKQVFDSPSHSLSQASVDGHIIPGDCFVPKPITEEIQSLMDYFESQDQNHPYFLPVVPNYFGSPFWEANLRFEDEDHSLNSNPVVSVIPAIIGDNQNVGGLYIFYEFENQIISLSMLRKNQILVELENENNENYETLNLLLDLFDDLDNQIFCDGSTLRCNPCYSKWNEFWRKLKVKANLWIHLLYPGDSSGGFSWTTADFGSGIDNTLVYQVIFNSLGGGSQAVSIWEDADKLSRLCNLLEDEANGEFQELSPQDIAELFSDVTESIEYFCDNVGLIFTCGAFTNSEEALLLQAYNDGYSFEVGEVADYFINEGCDVSQEEKDCLLSYVENASEHDVDLRFWQNNICGFCSYYEVDIYKLINSGLDINGCLESEDFSLCAVEHLYSSSSTFPIPDLINFVTRWLARNYSTRNSPYNQANDCEKQLINEHPLCGAQLGFNWISANLQTRLRMGDNIQNECSDAFRHTFFNALNSVYCGTQLAMEFGDAHECDSDSEMARDMDLHNNQIGYSIIENNPQIATSILSGNPFGFSMLVSTICTSLANGDMLIFAIPSDPDPDTNPDNSLISSILCECTN